MSTSAQPDPVAHDRQPAPELAAERLLEGGLVLRAASHDDIQSIVGLAVAAFGAADEPGVRAYLDGPGHDPADWTVVVDRDRVVACCGLLPLPLVLDGAEFAAAQIEYVVTDPGYQRRGLVRAQFDWHHARAARLGYVAQFIGGIPYFYRRFGYGYGVSYPGLYLFDRTTLSPDPTVSLRAATEHDLPALVALDQTRPREGLRMRRDDNYWRLWFRMNEMGEAAEHGAGERFFVAVRDGDVVGWSPLSLQHDEKRLLLLPTVTTDDGVTDAVITHALGLAGDSIIVVGHDTPGTGHGARVRAIGHSSPYGLGLYVRMADPVAFLRAIQPVLSARLANSAFGDASGAVEISLYQSGLVITYENGEVNSISEIPGVEDPFESFGCGVAPDWFPALALGRWGAKELEQRVDDVTLGRHADLLEVLFPRRDADVVADF